jgi:HK97 family phage portal protein
MIEAIKNAIWFTPRKEASKKGVFSDMLSYFFTNESDVYQLALCNLDVVSCINLIWENIGLWGIKVFDPKKKIIKEEDDRYKFIEENISELKKDFVKHKSIGGCVYITILKNESNWVAWLRCYGTNEVKYSNSVYTIKDKEIWEYTAKENEVMKCVFDTNHNNKPHGIVSTIKKDLMIEDEATSSMLMGYINKLRIWAIIKTSETFWTATSEEQKSLGETFKKLFTGSKNEASYYLGNAVDKVEMIDMSVKNEGIVSDRMNTTEKVCVAYRVPREILSYTQKWGSEAKIQGQDRIFMRMTMNTWDKSLQDCINKAFDYFISELPKEYLGLTIEIWSDKSVSTEEQNNIRANFEKWIITLDEARELLWFTPLNGKTTTSWSSQK